MKHTPGPWHAHVAADSLRIPDLVSAECGLHICDVASYGAAPSQKHANARLIAAAPDLLAELEQQLENAIGDLDYAEIEGDELSVETVKRRIASMEAALAKAKGQA